MREVILYYFQQHKVSLEISNSSGSQFLIEESTGYIGINNATPGYNLDIGGTLNTQTLYINDVNVSATATELSLLSGRSGTILDSNNISSFATTGVTAGAGLTGGGTTGILNLQVGAGSGIVVNTDDIAIKLATSASTNSTSSFSGLEVDADGIRLLSGCTNTQVLSWNGSAWECTTIGGISSVSGSGEIGQVTFWDSSSTLTGEDEFFYDTSTNRLGLGTTVPSYTLDVVGDIRASGDLRVAGDDIFLTTNTSGFILVADGTNYNPVAVSGDINIASNGTTTIQPDAVALGTDTTGNYVATIADAW
ncbi:MAG: hypothetical protein R3B92_01305 [Patescibacteria group bacterium]